MRARYWATFWAYITMLYVFEYAITNNALSSALGTVAFQKSGALYNMEPGSASSSSLHIRCTGFTTGVPAPRPTVILEAMEGLAGTTAMARLHDAIARRGVCCSYDRLGLGYSSAQEGSASWVDRSPTTVAKQLHFALHFGTDGSTGRPVSWPRTVTDSNNKTQVKLLWRITPRPHPFSCEAGTCGVCFCVFSAGTPQQ